MLSYLSIETCCKDDVFGLLYQSFEPMMNQELETKLKQYATQVYENPERVGACVFLTQLEKRIIGMASWDPRPFPKALVGYNCILPEFQGKGSGKQQLLELLSRLGEMHFTEVLATTGDHPFYEPSQRMYTRCGFQEIQRNATSGDPRHGSIKYRIDLNKYSCKSR